MTTFTTADGITIAHDVQGDGPPVLLLHGFPQTRAMWHAIAPQLAQHFTVVTADLRGYGASTKPAQIEDMSFRHMAADQRLLMQHLGFDHFHLVGHDRGARTAHRMALDSPETILSLTLMDIVPTHLLLDALTQQVARAYYHWFFLAQPAPFPETLIGHDPNAYFESCLAGWGGGMDTFDADALAAYRSSWRDPECIRTMCNDYRAAIDVDFDLDAADLGRTVDCPALILYGADGIMGQAYDVAATWADRLTNMQAVGLPGGHFFPDTHPEETTKAIAEFLKSQT
ncbi:fluoroacetate dehalogenase [Tateyamaria omphalii]|uniref:alpha/beta fold hydrolase n=1 Tax=Tateyamaria omphalii TaxID=299262 RepID=UPI001674F2A4|nr:alpha/beta hydrolase [Tateyamaria omphalii]GGX46946.1 fluoroacetate dehalogenase [Tateyamaria omphalii]